MSPPARHPRAALAALSAVVSLAAAARTLWAAPAARRASSASARPDATLYDEARAAETRLRASSSRSAKRLNGRR